MKLALLLFLTLSSSPAATVLRIVCGSNSPATDAQGNVWAADSGYTGGTAWTAATQANLPAPYRTVRFAATPLGYRFTLQPGAQYAVTLKFAEPNKTAAGQRQFGVNVQGAAVATLDLFTLAGTLTPWDATYSATTTATGLLSIDLVPETGKGNALISAIQIDTVDPPPPPATLPPCERTLGDGVHALGWPINPGSNMAYPIRACLNTSTAPLKILRFRCQSDAPAFGTIMLPDSNGRLQSVTDTIACGSPGGAEAVVVPGTAYPPNQALWFIVSVVSVNDPPATDSAPAMGYGNARQVLLTAVLGQ